MNRFTEQEIHKVNVLKRIILLRSKLPQVYGPQSVKIEVNDYDKNEQGDFIEISFSLKIFNVDCGECSFEMDYFTETIHKIYRNLYTTSQILVNSNLQSDQSGNSLRGILTHKITYRNDLIEEIEFGIFYDCDYQN